MLSLYLFSRYCHSLTVLPCLFTFSLSSGWQMKTSLVFRECLDQPSNFSNKTWWISGLLYGMKHNNFSGINFWPIFSHSWPFPPSVVLINIPDLTHKAMLNADSPLHEVYDHAKSHNPPITWGWDKHQPPQTLDSKQAIWEWTRIIMLENAVS